MNSQLFLTKGMCLPKFVRYIICKLLRKQIRFMKFRVPAPYRWLTFFLIICCSLGSATVHARPSARSTDRFEIDSDQDDTADIDTVSTVDTASDVQGLLFTGDFRPLVNYRDQDNIDGSNVSDTSARSRLRVKGVYGIADRVQLGVRIAWLCTTDDCSPEWVWDRAIRGPNGLVGGQFTFDELYVHIYRRDRFNITAGRQQTRFVLRGGVFARSLDRNDSNNTNVTWTDGIHATFRRQEGWATHFIIQRNAADGSGSIRRGPLDFDDSSAKNTFFVGFENTNSLGPIVQRSIDVSYLPNSLLKDGTTSGPREDYWAVVGRLGARWPQVTEGPRLRAGIEIGYAPERPSSAGAGIDAEVDGLAWNVVASVMDFKPRHSIGVNYGRTGAGWLLSPQFAPNEELFEIRYQWRPKQFPAIDARIRWREDIELQSGALQKREVLDAFVRITWQFGR